MTALTPIVSVTAFTNEPALLWIAENGPPPTVAELARQIGRDPDNLRKSLLLLVEEGLLAKDYGLTGSGEDAVDALRRMRGSAGLIEIDPALIDPNPYQPRKTPDPDADAEMAISVRDKGIAQPIRVRRIGDRYQQAFGHRRVAGALAAGRQVPCIVSDLTDVDMMELAGIENCQRSNLHWMDEAEYYLMLAEHGRSASQIIALVGEGGRSKRKIQELIQFARELSDEDKARCRLPKGHPQGLTVEQCRERTGEKTEKPPLALTPKLTLTLLELLDAAERQGRPINGAERVVQLYAAPTGGPIAALVNERKLARFGFEGPTILLKITVTEDMAKLLGLLRFDLDRGGALRKAREEVLGELQVGAMRSGEYATPELNRPLDPPPIVAPPAPASPAALATVQAPDEAREALTAANLAPAVEPAPAKAEPERLKLLPAYALALFEIAHAISDRELTTTAIEVSPDYYQDKLVQSLVFEKLIRLSPKGAATVVNLTPSAVSFICDSLGGALDDTFYEIGDDQLEDIQTEYGGGPPSGRRYLTSWLNPKQSAAAEVEAPAEDPLSPSQRRLLREIAGRSYHRSNLPDDVVKAHADGLSDPDWLALYERAFVVRLGSGQIALTLDGVAHFKLHNYRAERLSANSCVTPWLREDYIPETAQPDTSAQETPATETSTPPPRAADSFARQLNTLSAEAKAMAGLAGSLREAMRLLMASRSRKLTPHEIDQVCNLGEAALETAAKYLED